MKKYLLLISLSLILTACNTDEPETTSENEESEEIARLKEENEELKKQQGEQSKEQETEDEQTEEKSETSKHEEDSASVDDTDSETSDRSSLIFDINSPEVQAYINKNDNYDDQGNFIQDAISIGMSQTEVEDLYGKHDFTMMDPGSVAAVYENLAVLYSSQMPHGDGSDSTDSSIDPDSNSVEMILYFANITSEELKNALGSPDNQLQNLQGNQNYIYESNGWGNLIFSETGTPDGTKIGTMRGREVNTANQETVNEEDIPVTEAPNPDAEIQDRMIYEGAINEYLGRLAQYYNYDNYDNIYYYLKKGSAAYDKITANKASGNFTGHKTENVELVEMTDLGDGTVKLNANRVYSHDNSNGRRIANVDYIVNAETHEVLDFEQISDAAH
ncbi:hypothetical protein [Jeotgalicoccus meleagridis]|uniref:Lipoprotein n=1 Tax=Jeotgalicoccus meleagridis TaxID=2759181 RepID=A0A6V7R2R8_9STAP|nr:hypothetical protein [Jeotgalicoccus meleagridis]CAD2071649.1 hypothetical protein JEODO184_00336 [Jeotgalicoccus meleagridis]